MERIGAYETVNNSHYQIVETSCRIIHKKNWKTFADRLRECVQNLFRPVLPRD